MAVDYAILWLRILCGAGMMYHGIPKFTTDGVISGMTQGIAQIGFPLPVFFAYAASLSEAVGGALLIIGLLTRPAAFLIFVTMMVAGLMIHAKDPFQVKELAFAYATVAAALLIAGAGKFSLDRKLKLKI